MERYVSWKGFSTTHDFKKSRKPKRITFKGSRRIQKQVHQLQLEKALLERATELLKKEEGLNLLHLTNQEKTILIDALRNQFKLKEFLQQLQLSKSSYFYQK